MNDIAIRIENLGKQYRIGGPKGRYNYKRFSETAMAALRAPLRHLRTLGQPADSTETFWALRDVSFEVKEGEAVGIIGRNGAGKSTLLKILSRITEPTEGRAEIRGRVGSLLEVGTGFHPELTGRENIYLNGAILGMKKPEINRKFDEIVEFAEIGKFLDTPVKRYSSGMYVRLAFAVAAYLEPQILLVDEVLAVGDAAFQKKCLGKMGEVAVQGRTVLFVSHNMASIRSLCNRGILLDTGQVVSDDTMDNVVHEYVNRITKPTDEHSVELSEHPSRLPGMHPILTAVSIKNSDLSPCRTFFQSEEIVVEFTFDGREFDRSPGGAGFILEAANGSPVGAFNTYMTDYTPECFPECRMVRFCLKSPKLIAGRYLVTVSVGANQHSLIDKVDKAISFDVLPEDIYGTGFLLTPALGVVALQCDAKVVETS